MTNVYVTEDIICHLSNDTVKKIKGYITDGVESGEIWPALNKEDNYIIPMTYTQIEKLNNAKKKGQAKVGITLVLEQFKRSRPLDKKEIIIVKPEIILPDLDNLSMDVLVIILGRVHLAMSKKITKQPEQSLIDL